MLVLTVPVSRTFIDTRTQTLRGMVGPHWTHVRTESCVTHTPWDRDRVPRLRTRFHLSVGVGRRPENVRESDSHT